MEYQKAYKIANEIDVFFNFNLNGQQKAQISQIIINNVDGKEQENCDHLIIWHDREFTFCPKCGMNLK